MYDTEKTEKLLHFIRSELDRSLDRVGRYENEELQIFICIFFRMSSSAEREKAMVNAA